MVVALAHFEKLTPPNNTTKRRILRDIFERGRIKLLLAISDGAPVGYALYFYTYSSFLARPTLYLEDVFVLDRYRSLGIGRSLFLRCVREARRRGCGRMEWSVLNWNASAIRFYEKMGARRLSEWSAYRLDAKSLKFLGQRVTF